MNPDPAGLPLLAPFTQPMEMQLEPAGKSRAHYNITDFYTLRKVKCELNFSGKLTDKLLESATYTYTLDLKNRESIAQLIEACKTEGHSRIYVGLGLHTRQFKVNQISKLEKGASGFARANVKIPEEKQAYGKMPCLSNLKVPFEGLAVNLHPDVQADQSAKSWYLTPQMQASIFSKYFGSSYNSEGTPNVSRDLNTLEYLQREVLYYQQTPLQTDIEEKQDPILLRKPELYMAKFLTIKLKKQETKDIIEKQLDPEIKIEVKVGQVEGVEDSCPERITNFGIRAIDFKLEDCSLFEQHSHDASSLHHTMDTYFVTSDHYESSIAWLPQIFGTLRTPVGYTLKFVVPDDANVISSGKFIKRETIQSGSGQRSLYIYKNKPRPEKQKLDTATLLDKIGFIVGHFPYYSVFEQELIQGRNRTQIQLGLAMFASHQKHELFEAKNFYKQQIYAILKSMKEDIMKVEHPCKI